jgi:hypothetical protein
MMNHDAPKTAPRAAVLIRYASFYRSVFERVPNGVMLANTLTSAIVSVHEDM